MHDFIREIASFDDYALLDSGEGEKCERFGDIIVLRPDPLILWPKADENGAWKDAHAIYTREGEEGTWVFPRPLPSLWQIGHQDLQFLLRPTSFKHVGVFPEQAANWQWMQKHLSSKSHVLNLFAYTGGATLAAVQRGASVVHVDASGPVVNWAKENAVLSGLSGASVRWLVDDVMKFARREVRRGNIYDMIVMDPPAFGRGPKNELWKFERDLPELLSLCKSILNPKKGTMMLNAYSLGYPLLCLEQLVETVFPKQTLMETVELVLQEKTSRAFALPTGVTVRVVW